MSAADIPRLALRRYLLGTLAEADAAGVDERILGDPSFADEVAEVEDALIDAYLDAHLTAEEHAPFRQHYLAVARHRERVAFRRALRSRPLEAEARGRAPAMARWLAIAASLVIAAAGGWWVFSPRNDMPHSSVSVAPAATPREATPPSPSRAPGAPSAAPAQGETRAIIALAVSLAPVVTRGGGGGTTVTVARSVAQVELRLLGDLPAADTLIAELMSVDAPDAVQRWPVDAASPAADGASASVMLPAYVLAPGDYIVTVWQGDADAVQRYTFRVVP